MGQAGLAIDDAEPYVPDSAGKVVLACDLGLFTVADDALLAEAAAS